LKKLNGSLTRVGPFDDLIGDTYAYIYQIMVPALVIQSAEAENRERMRVDHLLMNVNEPSEPRSSPAPTDVDHGTARARPKTVGRQEIRRRAEALITRPAAPALAPKPKPATGVQGPMNRFLAARDDAKDVASSVPGSVHDSADESELSDIDEDLEGEEDQKEEEKPPPSPGPVQRKTVGEESEMEGVEDASVGAPEDRKDAGVGDTITVV
jgi:hypothetical protein